MRKDHLEPVAEMLMRSYTETADYSIRFNDDYGRPPTVMAKAHNMRSIAQALLAASERFQLAEPYSEFGRIEFDDPVSEKRYRLRSQGALAVERRTVDEALFDATDYLSSDVVLLVYDVGPDNLTLSVVGSRRVAGSQHTLHATGAPIVVGDWPWMPRAAEAFDQDEAADAFAELGALDIEEGEGIE